MYVSYSRLLAVSVPVHTALLNMDGQPCKRRMCAAIMLQRQELELREKDNQIEEMQRHMTSMQKMLDNASDERARYGQFIIDLAREMGLSSYGPLHRIMDRMRLLQNGFDMTAEMNALQDRNQSLEAELDFFQQLDRVTDEMHAEMDALQDRNESLEMRLAMLYRLRRMDMEDANKKMNTLHAVCRRMMNEADPQKRRRLCWWARIVSR